MHCRLFANGLFTAIAVCLATGCIDSVDSGAVETEGLWADFEAVVDQPGETRIDAGLKTEGRNSNTYANLSDGDELVFVAGGRRYEPSPTKSFGTEYAYGTTVSESDGGTEIRIAFLRDTGRDAPDSRVRLPGEFEIESPDSRDTYSRSLDDIWVKLDHADPDATNYLEVRGPCLERDYENDFVGRSITIPHEELDSDDYEDEQRCQVELTVERRLRGSVDPAFEGGEFVAEQVRETSFRSVP